MNMKLKSGIFRFTSVLAGSAVITAAAVTSASASPRVSEPDVSYNLWKHVVHETPGGSQVCGTVRFSEPVRNVAVQAVDRGNVDMTMSPLQRASGTVFTYCLTFYRGDQHPGAWYVIGVYADVVGASPEAHSGYTVLMGHQVVPFAVDGR
jgi:hypothetical protein